MPSIIKSLIAKTRRTPSAEDAESLQRSNQVLQFRVQQIVHATPADVKRAAA